MGLLVSINCITYNHEDYIADAINSFLMQKTNFEFEILIGEDCSTDNTRKIIERFIEKYPGRIQLITSEKNVGWRKNEERLFKKSKGKYIAICEGDDFWTDPYKLQKQVDYMEKNPDCSFCFHAASIVYDNGKKSRKIIRPYQHSRISSLKDLIIHGDFCPTASLLFPKNMVDTIPDFYKNAHVGDYPMQMWLGSKGHVYYIDEVMSAYRVGVKGSWRSQMNTVKNWIIHKDNDIKLLDEFNKNTNYKFNDYIQEAKVIREFEKLLLQNKVKEIKNTKYIKFYHNLHFIEKVKVHLRYFFPIFYEKLAALKRNGVFKLY